MLEIQNHSVLLPPPDKLGSGSWAFYSLPSIVVAYTIAVIGQFFLAGSEQGRFLGSVFPHQLLMLLAVLVPAVFIESSVSLKQKLWIDWHRHYLIWAMVAELILFPAMILISIMGSLIFKFLDINVGPPMVYQLVRDSSWPQSFILAGAAILLAPLVEELVFRRVIFGCVKALFGTVVALTVTSVLFAMIHMSLLQFAPLFILAVVLQLLVIYHRSIIPAILLHMLHNGIAIFFLLLMKLFHEFVIL